MRYYDLTISNPGGQIIRPSPSGNGFTYAGVGPSFSSHVNGMLDLGALNLELDVPVAPLNTPQGQGWLRIWGVGLQCLGQASDLNNFDFMLSAGMRPGLPLATAAAGQAGIIAQGQIYRAYGNWQGVNQTLELVAQPSATNQGGPIGGISFSWKKGSSLADAITTTLAQAFPKYKRNVNIAPALVLPYDQPGTYESLIQFASVVFDLSQKTGASTYGPSYRPVQISITGNTLNVYDSTAPAPKPTVLVFQDLIGQPTWIDPGTINFKTVMRSDLALGKFVLFPAGIVSPYALSSSAASPGVSSSSKTVFQGAFVINEVHHFGNFRQCDADSWVTAFNAVPALPGTTGLP